MEKVIINIGGMSCEHCVKAVTTAIEALDGVKKVKVSLKNNSADVRFDPAKTSLGAIHAAIKAEDYEVL